MSLQSPLQQPQQEETEMEKRITLINNALNTVTNLQAQLNGISSQLGMILGNLGNIGQGLQENIQYLIQTNNVLDAEVLSLKKKVEDLTPKEEEKPVKKKSTKDKTE